MKPTDYILKDYLEERNKALTELDMDWAMCQMPDASDEVRLVAMHKARVNCLAVTGNLRKQSAKWLVSKGYSTFCSLMGV